MGEATARHLRLDPVGGIAGDMFAAALLDAFPELEAGLLAALEAAGILRLARVERRDHRDHALVGSRFEVREVATESSGAHDHGHHHSHNHGHRDHRDIRRFLTSANLPDGVRERALDIFARLARAEAKVHGLDPEEVSFHEVGQWDSITDVVSAAWLIEALGAASWSSEPLPLGRGRVETAHGSLPIPAPATAVLLEGLPTFEDGHRGERVTPTGAAILRHLAPSFEPRSGVHRLVGSGTGFGTAEFEGLSNTLRLLVFEPVESLSTPDVARSERITVCAFEIDDQTAEDLAVGLDRVRSLSGVLDVVQSPVLGKKGRLATSVQVLVEPDAAREAVAACFGETTTLGVRWHSVERAVLEREQRSVEVDGRAIRVKRAVRPGGAATAKAESDDLGEARGGREERERLRRRAEASGDDEGSGSRHGDGD